MQISRPRLHRIYILRWFVPVFVLFPEQTLEICRFVPIMGRFPEQTPEIRRFVPETGCFPEQMPRNYRFVPETGCFSEQKPRNYRFVPETRCYPEQTGARLSGPMAEQFRNNAPVQTKHPLNLSFRGIIVAPHRFRQFDF